MKKQDIQIGGVYLMKVSGKVVPVRVEDIIHQINFRGRAVITYRCLNTITNRECKAYSATKFRGKAPIPQQPESQRTNNDLPEETTVPGVHPNPEAEGTS